jgi:hypothetical protein
MKNLARSRRWISIALLTAAAAFGIGCVTEADEGATEQALINPGESAQVIEARAGESLTVTNGAELGVLEGVFRIKVGGAWSTVGPGLYQNVTEAKCVSIGRIASLPGRVLMAGTDHTHWSEWSKWN